MGEVREVMSCATPVGSENNHKAWSEQASETSRQDAKDRLIQISTENAKAAARRLA